MFISQSLGELIDRRLADYCKSKEIRKKWAKIIIERAILFYLNNNLDSDNLDSAVADEDLYQEKKSGRNIYVNLDYGLDELFERIQKELSYYK